MTLLKLNNESSLQNCVFIALLGLSLVTFYIGM